ncbi:prolyl oligopeptidase family serine peptidase [Radiobacillus sp. PE A8.2]|uniref:prolyl oligopeptidase family serine peptidase n=1 Tax=Radiobacillus sp. PE A8.2 TaxID=3380349 RepID=UPI003890E9F0
MIEIHKQYWQEIPVLIVVDDKHSDSALPVLTYLHGFTSAKEHNLPLAFLMAEKGYRVVLPDCLYHGERDNGVNNKERELHFFYIVEQNIKDLYVIKQELDKRNWIKDNRFGLAGTSMGGITTAAALTQYEWIKTAAILMGSPKITAYAKALISNIRKKEAQLPLSENEIELIFKTLEQIDLSKQMEKLNQRPLFFWHGENDSVVPFDHSYSFYEAVIPSYKNPESIRFLREPGRDHKVSRYAVLETVDWFELQL